MQKLRLDLPIRTSKRKKEARSPKQQRDMAYACAAANGYEIVMVHDSGRNESGKTMDRASLNLSMQRIRDGKTDGIIVALTDRLGRAPIEEAMAFVRELMTAGGVLVLADTGGQPINLADPNVETNLVIQLQIARQYWLAMATRMHRTVGDAVRSGKFVGPTPLGYQRHQGRLSPGPLAPAITEAYRLAGSRGIHAAADYLRGQVPNRRWDTDAVRRLLASRAYLGESRNGELVNREAHEPLVSPAEWAAAQTEPQARRGNGDYPLTHVATCGRCGAGMVGGLKTHARTGRSYRRMTCSAQCPCSVSADNLEAHVREAVAAKAGDKVFRLSIEPVGRADAEAALETAVLRRSRFMEGMADTDMPADVIAVGAAKVQAAVVEAEGALRAVASSCARREDFPAAAEIREDDEQLLAAIRACVGSIAVRPGRGSIEDRVVVLFNEDDDGLGVLAA